MALNYKSRYPAQTDTDAQKYPYGKARNISTPVSEDGTPWERDLINDQWGFLQAMLTSAGIVPNGTPDSADSSQYLDAMGAVNRDKLALKVFTSPTNSSTTLVETFTKKANTVYEVRNASDDSLATIYSDPEATSSITQNSVGNKSNNKGEVSFYIKNGEYYIDVGGSRSRFSSVISVGRVGHLKEMSEYAKGVVIVHSFYEGGDVGGGVFVFDPSKERVEHNGGTIIAPERLVSWDGTFSGINTLYEAPTTGVGCFVRLGEDCTVDNFGAVSSEVGNIDVVLSQMVDSGFKAIVANNLEYLTENFVPSTYGIEFRGSASFKIKTGHVFKVSVCEQDYQTSTNSIMFTDVDWDWGTVSYLKSIGYDTIFSYGLFNQNNQLALLRSCSAAKSKILAYSNSTTASLPQIVDDFKEVIGYYIYDEPDATGAPISTQDARINSYRQVTRKPLWCSLAIDSELDQLASDNFDYALIQVYYGETETRTKYGGGTVSRSNILRTLELMGSFKYKMPTTEIIPIVGLFTNDGFSNNTSSIANFATDAVRTSLSGTFAVFIWGGNTDPLNKLSVKDNDILLAGSKTVKNSATNNSKIEITPIIFASDNDFSAASLEGTTTSMKTRVSPDTNNVFPVSVENVGSAVSTYKQAFHEQGVAAQLEGGYSLVSIDSRKASGVIYSKVTYKNLVALDDCSIGLSVTRDGGYTFENVIDELMSTGTSSRFWMSPLSVVGDKPYTVALRVTPQSSNVEPWKFACGWIHCSNWPDVTY